MCDPRYKISTSNTSYTTCKILTNKQVLAVEKVSTGRCTWGWWSRKILRVRITLDRCRTLSFKFWTTPQQNFKQKCHFLSIRPKIAEFRSLSDFEKLFFATKNENFWLKFEIFGISTLFQKILIPSVVPLMVSPWWELT